MYEIHTLSTVTTVGLKGLSKINIFEWKVNVAVKYIAIQRDIYLMTIMDLLSVGNEHIQKATVIFATVSVCPKCYPKPIEKK